MRFVLISDNHDTAVGMRLAGIRGTVAETTAQVDDALDAAVSDASVGIVLITEKCSRLAAERIKDLKLHRRRPLVVEIPDRHADGRSRDSITRYVQEAIGVHIDPGGDTDAE